MAGRKWNCDWDMPEKYVFGLKWADINGRTWWSLSKNSFYPQMKSKYYTLPEHLAEAVCEWPQNFLPREEKSGYAKQLLDL